MTRRLTVLVALVVAAACDRSPTESALPITLAYTANGDSIAVFNSSARPWIVNPFFIDPADLPFTSVAVCAGAPLGPGQRVVYAVPKVSYPLYIDYCDYPVSADLAASHHRLTLPSPAN